MFYFFVVRLLFQGCHAAEVTLDMEACQVQSLITDHWLLILEVIVTYVPVQH